jgi:hypothetical protein
LQLNILSFKFLIYNKLLLQRDIFSSSCCKTADSLSSLSLAEVIFQETETKEKACYFPSAEATLTASEVPIT